MFFFVMSVHVVNKISHLPVIPSCLDNLKILFKKFKIDLSTGKF